MINDDDYNEDDDGESIRGKVLCQILTCDLNILQIIKNLI